MPTNAELQNDLNKMNTKIEDLRGRMSELNDQVVLLGSELSGTQDRVASDMSRLVEDLYQLAGRSSATLSRK